MRIALAALLLLSACSGPSEYRFPPANPAPTYTPPGTGLPSMPAPRPGVSPLPRSPSKRVLPPPGKEPGVYASDGDFEKRWLKRAEDARTRGAYVFPAPVDLEPAEQERIISCASSIYAAASAANLLSRLDQAGDAVQRCFYAQMYRACAEYGGTRAREAQKELEIVVWWNRINAVAKADSLNQCQNRAAKTAADLFVKRPCLLGAARHRSS